jgi:hypothetical protein
MRDSACLTDYEVEVEYGGKRIVWFIRALDKQKALAVAALRLKHRPKGNSKVITAREAQKK